MNRNLNRRIHPIAEADGLSPKKPRKYYCLYCKHYKPTQCGSEGTGPEGICCNPHTATDYVYGHDYCEQYDERK